MAKTLEINPKLQLTVLFMHFVPIKLNTVYLLLIICFIYSVISSVCDTVIRFDLLANGGASLTLNYERAPFPTLHRTVWLPWNVFHVMDTVVMKREENDIPSCYLTGLIRPNPLILATPLSTLYKSSPEDSPIIPETQVRPQQQRSPSQNTLLGFLWSILKFMSISDYFE